MDQGPSVAQSYGKVLKTHREHLVAHISNTQCLLDNLLENGYFTAEDVEIVGAYATKPSQVRGQVAGVRGKTRVRLSPRLMLLSQSLSAICLGAFLHQT